MKPNLMHRIGHRGCHECAPKGYHTVPNLTGDMDFDATIMHRSNKDLPNRLRLYVKRGYRTSYGGYDGNHGDD